MAKTSMDAVLKRRMAASHQASELHTSDDAYQQIFQRAPPPAPAQICELPLDKLDSFFTADIGFKLYPPLKLKAFAQQLQEEGLLIRVIVRRIPGTDRYEILDGHNRVEAAKISGWTTIGAEIVEADDARAITIATVTNLIQRQDLSIMERGKAYKALLDVKNQQGHRSDLVIGTSGENRQKYSARALVAEFFGVTEYEIRKVIRLTHCKTFWRILLSSSISPVRTWWRTMMRKVRPLLWRYAALRATGSISPPCSTSSAPVLPPPHRNRLFLPHGGRHGLRKRKN